MSAKPVPPNWGQDFPVVGQGTIIFNFTRSTDFYIKISPKLEVDQPGANEYITLDVGRYSCHFSMFHNGLLERLKRESGIVKGEPVGWDPEYKTSYWFSYNRDLLQLKYGKGYYMEETTLMTYDFIAESGALSPEEEEVIREEFKYLFSPYIRRRIEQYDLVPKDILLREYVERMKTTGMFQGRSISEFFSGFATYPTAKQDVKLEELAGTMIDVEKKVAYDQNPFVANWSPIVLDSKKVNLFNLNSNDFTFSASLPGACLELFSNVTGTDMQLDWPYTDKYKFSDAIQHSIDDDNGILHKKLETKTEFGSLEMTYLRVTLGPNRGKSAGIPYVLEIWPQGHGSPIHNHGNCYAVITVLHGGLTIQCFNKQTRTTDAKPLMGFDVTQGDTTWISPNWFQTHKLWNHSKTTFCATIQCYQYSKVDLVQWPYFDYVSEEDTIDEFLPDSDYNFTEMYNLVMAEYKVYMESQKK